MDFYFFAFPCLPIQRTPTGTDQSWSRPVHLPNAAHKVLSSILCLFWLHLAELVRSDEPNTFFAVWQEDVQSAASNLPALFKGLNSGWPWPQTASCLALGGSGILVCFIARDSCTKPGRVPLLKLLQSLEPNRINAIKKSSQEWSARPCFSSLSTQGYLYTSPLLSQSKAMTDMDNKPNKGVEVSLTRLCLSACYLPSQRLRALWLSWPKVSAKIYRANETGFSDRKALTNRGCSSIHCPDTVGVFMSSIWTLVESGVATAQRRNKLFHIYAAEFISMTRVAYRVCSKQSY